MCWGGGPAYGASRRGVAQGVAPTITNEYVAGLRAVDAHPWGPAQPVAELRLAHRFKRAPRLAAPEIRSLLVFLGALVGAGVAVAGRRDSRSRRAAATGRSPLAVEDLAEFECEWFRRARWVPRAPVGHYHIVLRACARGSARCARTMRSGSSSTSRSMRNTARGR